MSVFHKEMLVCTSPVFEISRTLNTIPHSLRMFLESAPQAAIAQGADAKGVSRAIRYE
jgi:hypothetical protein